MSQDSTEKQFETYRESLFRQCEHLISIISLYRHIYERQNDRLDELNLAPCFFSYTLASFFTTIIIWAEKLLSPNPKQRGLLDFLTFIENNIELFSIEKLQERRNYRDGHWMLNNEPITYDTIQEDRKKLTGLCLDNIKKRRNKFQAHFDKEYFFNREQLSADAPIKWEQLTKITQVISDIFTKYSTAYDGSAHSFKIVNINDIDHILDILHKRNNK